MNATQSSAPTWFQPRPTPQPSANSRRPAQVDRTAERPSFARELRSQHDDPAVATKDGDGVAKSTGETNRADPLKPRTVTADERFEQRPMGLGEEEADLATFAAFQSIGIPAAEQVDDLSEVVDPDALIARPDAFGLPVAKADELPAAPESKPMPPTASGINAGASSATMASEAKVIPVITQASDVTPITANAAMVAGVDEGKQKVGAASPVLPAAPTAEPAGIAAVPGQPQQAAPSVAATSSTPPALSTPTAPVAPAAPSTPDAVTPIEPEVAQPSASANWVEQVPTQSEQPVTAPPDVLKESSEAPIEPPGAVRANAPMNATKVEVISPDTSAAPVAANAPMKVAESAAPQPLPMPTDTAPIGRDNGEAVTSAIRQVATGTTPGRQSVTIRLDPPQLGSVRVHVQVIDGQATATIATSNEVAHGLVRGSLDQLQQSLERSGVGIDRVQVTRMGSMSAAEHNANAGRDQQQQGDGQSAGREQQQQQQRDQTRREALLRFWNRGGFDAEAA